VPSACISVHYSIYKRIKIEFWGLLTQYGVRQVELART
jgi:hypothetical protein